jgi:putative acetyltransferase
VRYKDEVTQKHSIAVAVESPLQDDVRGLVEELNATLLELTPPEFVFHMTAEQMAEVDTTVFIAREDGQAVACGALKRHADGVGEVKRMYTRPSHRGRKIGAMIVERIEALARQEGFERLVLETGDQHPAAWAVYERAGFTRCGPVLDYPDSKWSVFYEKALTPSSRHSP